MKQNDSSKTGLFLSLIVMAAAAFGYYQRDAIFDIARLHNYQPSAEIAGLASDTTMTPGTRRLFYVYHPSLEDKQSFNAHCTESEQTIVLGCYISHRGIYLYDVTDDRLRGVEQVTAAHETLHAAYERLSSRQKKRIDALTADAFSKVTDERIKSTVESYRKKDPTVVPNELHSILGTEVRELPAELEAYYQQYFSDRSAVVAFSLQYESEFESREQQREAYDNQLAQLKVEIDALSNGLSTREKQISSAYQELLRQRESGDTAGYNRGVPSYNASVNDYNIDVNRVQAMTRQYNDIVEKRNALVVEEGQLLKALDSRPTAIEQQ